MSSIDFQALVAAIVVLAIVLWRTRRRPKHHLPSDRSSSGRLFDSSRSVPDQALLTTDPGDGVGDGPGDGD